MNSTKFFPIINTVIVEVGATKYLPFTVQETHKIWHIASWIELKSMTAWRRCIQAEAGILVRSEHFFLLRTIEPEELSHTALYLAIGQVSPSNAPSRLIVSG